MLNNPYIIGNPVPGDLLVGRENILCQLKELWLNNNHVSFLSHSATQTILSNPISNISPLSTEKCTIINYLSS